MGSYLLISHTVTLYCYYNGPWNHTHMNCNDTVSTLFCGRHLPDFIKLAFPLLWAGLFSVGAIFFRFIEKIWYSFVNGQTNNHVFENSLYVDKLYMISSQDSMGMILPTNNNNPITKWFTGHIYFSKSQSKSFDTIKTSLLCNSSWDRLTNKQKS